MRIAIRLLILSVLTAGQVLHPLPVKAGARLSKGAMDAGLYHAVLDATAKDAARLQANGTGFSLNTPNLNYHLNGRGLSVSADDQGWSWSLQLDGFGREDQTNSLFAPKFSQNSDRAELKFGMSLTEWYRDTGIGLEQGFTINQNPKGNGKLVLLMALDSSLKGTLSDDERSLSFDAGNGQSLHYSDLRVFDANGNELDAKIIYTPSQVVVHVDDGGAVYPLTVDPLIYIEQKQQVNGSVHENLGCTLALQGDTAVVGAPEADSSQGAAYVFVRSNSIWSLQAKLTASDGVAGDQLGIQVALDGDTILVGSYFADVGANADQGAAYIFVKPGGGWATGTETAKLTASDGAAGDDFGSSTALSGDTAVIGAGGDDIGATNIDQGSAYVFVKPGTGWATGTQAAKLIASDGAAGDQLGNFRGVAISGDTALVAAAAANSYQGAAYIFNKPADGWPSIPNPSFTAKLTISGGLPGDGFGSSVVLSGDNALIGTPGYNSNQGAAYIFIKPGGGWATTNLAARLTASDGAVNDEFGYSVAMDGNTALIGSIFDDVTFTDQGSAYVFIKPTAGNWSSTSAYASKLTASDPALSDWLGTQVALSGDTALVGAPLADVNLGAVYFYYPYRTDQDLATGAAVNNASPRPFDTVIFTATVSNFGSANAPYVQVSAPLPAGFTYVSSTAMFGTYDSFTGSWDVGTVNFGVTATLKIVATVGSSLAGSSPTFTVKTLGTDLNPANNSASVSLHVPLLSFSPSPLSFGNRLVFTTSLAKTVTVTNLSDDDVKLGTLKVPLGFILSSNTCTSGKILDSYSACTFKVQFKPTTTTLYTGNITLASSVPTDTAVLPVSGTGAKPTQLLTNRSFEIDSNLDKIPDGWSTDGTTWAVGDGVNSSFHYAGTRSVKFAGDGTTKKLAFTVNRSGPTGDKYSFGVYVAAQAIPVVPLTVHVDVYNGVTNIGGGSITVPTGTYAFKHLILNFVTPGAYTKLVVILDYNLASGTIYYDNASLIWNP
jgi:uncharacterized repeat protein (TIGR01451 family)